MRCTALRYVASLLPRDTPTIPRYFHACLPRLPWQPYQSEDTRLHPRGDDAFHRAFTLYTPIRNSPVARILRKIDMLARYKRRRAAQRAPSICCLSDLLMIKHAMVVAAAGR